MADNTKSPDTVTDIETETDTTVKIDDSADVTKKPGSLAITLLYFLFIAFVAATAATAFYFWQQQIQYQESQLADISNLQQQIHNTQSDIQALNQPIQTNRQAIETLQLEQQQLLEISSKAIETTNRNQRGWIMAEIDYLLQIANRRLQISRDINSSIAALEAANTRLLDLADINLYPVRKQLAIDIAKLKALHQIDINGTALAIDQMIVHLNQLPFKTVQDEVKTQLETPTETTADAAVEKNMLDTVLATVMKIGDIKIHQRSIQPSSSTLQQQQIEQLLHTHLLSARLAILRYDQAQFSHDIDITRQLLHLHYQASDNRVTQIIKDLDGFSSLILNPDLPDITTAWSLLHKTNATGQQESPAKNVGVPK